MACFPTQRRSDDGYATPAALVLSLALALVASALVARSVQVLTLARGELQRTRQALALDGAHLQAAAEVVRDGRGGPFRWHVPTDLGEMEALAEAESDKLDLTAAAALDDGVFTAFGVRDPEVLKARLRAASEDAALATVAELDPAPLWRECGPRLASPFGQAEALAAPDRLQPTPGVRPPAWHVGDVWRVRIATSAGWRDDRIVRFTGDARRPAAIVWRRFSRGKRGGVECDIILNAVLAS